MWISPVKEPYRFTIAATGDAAQSSLAIARIRWHGLRHRSIAQQIRFGWQSTVSPVNARNRERGFDTRVISGCIQIAVSLNI